MVMQDVEYSQAFVDKAANLTYQEVSSVFHLPLHEACVQLRVDESSLKKRCRVLNISRWPYRKRCALIKEIDVGVSNQVASNANNAANQHPSKKSSSKMFHSFSLGKKEDEEESRTPVESPKKFWKEAYTNSRDQKQPQTPTTPSYSHSSQYSQPPYPPTHYQTSQFSHSSAPYYSQPSTPTSTAQRLPSSPFSQTQSPFSGSQMPQSPFSQVPSSPFSREAPPSPFSQVPSSPFSKNQGPSFHDRPHQPTLSNAVHYEPQQARPSEFYLQQQNQHIRAPTGGQNQQPVLPSFNDFLARMDNGPEQPMQPYRVSTPKQQPPPPPYPTQKTNGMWNEKPSQRTQETYQPYPVKETPPQSHQPMHHQQINTSGYSKISNNNGRFGFSSSYQEQPNNYVQHHQHY